MRWRCLIVLLGLTAVGAVVNITVAWGCVLTRISHGSFSTGKWSVNQPWPVQPPTDWPVGSEWDAPARTGYQYIHARNVSTNRTCIMEVVRAGLPFKSLTATRAMAIPVGAPQHFDPPEWRYALGAGGTLFGVGFGGGVLPLQPVWPGFAMNTVVYGAVSGVLYVGLRRIRTGVRP